MAPARNSETDWSAQIAAVGRRDRMAFAVLFAHFAPRIKALMQRSGADAALADELAQETMLAVWRKAEQFDPQTTGAAAWIFTIARNLRVDAWRRRRGDASTPWQVEAEFTLDEAPLPDERLAASQGESHLHKALAALTPDQKRVVELSFFEERPHSEIAELLELPLGTVKSRLRLAMKRLRSILGDVQ